MLWAGEDERFAQDDTVDVARKIDVLNVVILIGGVQRRGQRTASFSVRVGDGDAVNRRVLFGSARGSQCSDQRPPEMRYSIHQRKSTKCWSSGKGEHR